MCADLLLLRCPADVTPAQLLGDTLVNTTIAILAYHYLPDQFYTEVRLFMRRLPLHKGASTCLMQLCCPSPAKLSLRHGCSRTNDTVLPNPAR
jgi:hypothetical protein